MAQEMKSKWLLLGGMLLAAVAVLLLQPFGEENTDGSLVVASWGGSFQDAQRQALFQPFTEETGIRIIETTGPSLAKLKAMVDSGRAEWDVALMTPADVLRLREEGYLAQIDYGDPELKAVLADIDERAVLEHGIGDFFSSKVIAYNTEYFSEDHHPRNWAEFWDVKRFPGPRVIDAGDWSAPPIEYALLADGVKPEKLYPLDFERAYRSIKRLAPHVLKFSTSPVMPAQALVDGEAALAAVTLGRVAQLKQQGAPVDFEWNHGLMEVNYWVIVANTDNHAEAMRFIKFTTRPEVQAAMAELQPLGPSNRNAFNHLPEERARLLPTYPQNRERQIVINAAFWAEADASGATNAERNAALWQKFKLSQQ